MSLGGNRLTPEILCVSSDLSHSRGLTTACYAEAAMGGWGVMRSAQTHVGLTILCMAPPREKWQLVADVDMAEIGTKIT
jgi:hypothetical protein